MLVTCAHDDTTVVRTLSSWPSWGWVGLWGAALCIECLVSLWWGGSLTGYHPAPGTVHVAVFSCPDSSLPGTSPVVSDGHEWGFGNRLTGQLLTGLLPAESRAGALRV